MTPKIVDYWIVEGSQPYVTDAVTDALKDGWQPFGCLAYCGEAEFEDSEDGELESAYAQALVKYADALPVPDLPQ